LNYGFAAVFWLQKLLHVAPLQLAKHCTPHVQDFEKKIRRGNPYGRKDMAFFKGVDAKCTETCTDAVLST